MSPPFLMDTILMELRWRHQYDDSIKTEEFLLYSISHEQISKLYEGLVETQFYYMGQQAQK